MILRTYGSEEAYYYDGKSFNKYLEGRRSQFVINNVSDEDLGILYKTRP